jgi:hypothetical protein
VTESETDSDPLMEIVALRLPVPDMDIDGLGWDDTVLDALGVVEDECDLDGESVPDADAVAVFDDEDVSEAVGVMLEDAEAVAVFDDDHDIQGDDVVDTGNEGDIDPESELDTELDWVLLDEMVPDIDGVAVYDEVLVSETEGVSEADPDCDPDSVRDIVGVDDRDFELPTTGESDCEEEGETDND